MNERIAFVGDIHGNLSALSTLITELASAGLARVVFLGDYINKGPHSAEVMQLLLDESSKGTVTLLAGNHETALLEALDTDDLAGFLRMGGAMTIRSYTQGPIGPDVMDELRRVIPDEHVAMLRAMPSYFETNALIAQHRHSTEPTTKFQISAHTPVGTLPVVSLDSARLDTGCGSDPQGRLTALLWPSLDFIQVDAIGEVIR